MHTGEASSKRARCSCPFTPLISIEWVVDKLGFSNAVYAYPSAWCVYRHPWSLWRMHLQGVCFPPPPKFWKLFGSFRPTVTLAVVRPESESYRLYCIYEYSRSSSKQYTFKKKKLTYSRWTSSLPSCLWSLRIFPSLPGSRLAFFIAMQVQQSYNSSTNG